MVTCQNERSQVQNRENALKFCERDCLAQEEKRQKELTALRGDYVKAEFGSQIRSYVLHPYQLVKDHRTDYETSQTSAVLNGQLDGFMEAYLRARVGQPQ